MTAQTPDTAVPALIHAGRYELYRTSSGGLLIRYQRTAAADDDGQVAAVEDAPIEVLPEIPKAAVDMMASLQTGKMPSAKDMVSMMMAAPKIGGRR